MDNNQDLLMKLEKHARQQATLTKVLVVLCAVMMVCTLVLTVFAMGSASQVAKLAEDAEFVMENLNVLSWELANADIGTMVENMGTLAADSQNIVAAAMKKLDAIDIETLNKAIQDLADIVAPLAKVSNFFG